MLRVGDVQRRLGVARLALLRSLVCHHSRVEVRLVGLTLTSSGLGFLRGDLGTTLRLALVDGALDPEFIRLGRKSKAGEATPADEARWTELKEALAVAVLSTPAADLFVEV